MYYYFQLGLCDGLHSSVDLLQEIWAITGAREERTVQSSIGKERNNKATRAIDNSLCILREEIITIN